MANKDNALGFLPYHEGSSAKPLIQRMTLASSAKAYPGLPLKYSAGLLTAVTDADDIVAAVAVGYADEDSTSAVDNHVLAITNLDEVVFRVQCNGAVAEADLGKYMKPLVASSDTTLKVSRFEADYTTVSATVGKTGSNPGRTWELIGKVNEPGNDWGADCDVLVKWRRNLDA